MLNSSASVAANPRFENEWWKRAIDASHSSVRPTKARERTAFIAPGSKAARRRASRSMNRSSTQRALPPLCVESAWKARATAAFASALSRGSQQWWPVRALVMHPCRPGQRATRAKLMLGATASRSGDLCTKCSGDDRKRCEGLRNMAAPLLMGA
eukprot:scaffold19854_cov64-Phaeocystis_antarctica.AAC.5